MAPTAFSAISGDRNLSSIGGAEVQQSILAKALVRRGYKVSMICMDHGQPDTAIIDGVVVIKAHKPTAGVPVVRFLHPRLSSIWRCLRKANADIYYQRAADMLTGVVANYCRKNEKKLIYSCAHDADFEEKLAKLKYQRDRWLFKYGVRKADQIIVQNNLQKNLLYRNYGRVSRIVPSCYDVPRNSQNDPDGYILWVATLREWKRPAFLIDIAKNFPGHKLKMVGGPGGTKRDQVLFSEVKASASKLKNVEFVGYVPYADIDHQFDGARLFVNTSDHEGFPNTFLQSWARGIPTVSFIGCDARMENKAINHTVDNVSEMHKVIDRLMSDEDEWSRSGMRCKAYYKSFHTVDIVTTLYEDIFRGMAKA